MYATSPHIHNVHNHYHSHQQLPIPHPIPLPTTLPSIPPPQPPQPHPPQRNTAPQPPKEPIVVLGIPSVSIEGNHLLVGSSQTSLSFTLFVHIHSYILLSSGSTRSYTPLKVLGDGSFGTVWLCDWHGTLPPNTPLSPMQCGQGARPEWTGKRLVAVKRMKKRWEGGWDECQQLKELEVSPSSIFTSQRPHVRLSSLCAPYLSMKTLSLCTIFFFCLHPRNSTLSSSQWKATCTILSRPERDVHLLVDWSRQYFARLFPAWTTFTAMVTFTEI